MDTIITQALAAVSIVKVVVDIAKMSWPGSPDWLPPTLALFGGPVVVALLMVANGDALSQQLGAQAVLAGILAAGGAVGVSEIGKRASGSVYLKVGSNGH